MVLTDEQWAVLEPLVIAARPVGKRQHRHLRRTLDAILWRCCTGANWRAIPQEMGPWWGAAQTFFRWAHLGIWPRLLCRLEHATAEEGDNTTTWRPSANTSEDLALAQAERCVRHLANLIRYRAETD